ncbi:MAG: Gfo/Idh/MocA family protein [Burkholderiales bacterium]
MLRIVVVGTGWWGMELGKAAKAVIDKVELLGCTSLSVEECERFSASYGGKIFPSFESVLADRTVDAVLLATPHSMHWKQIIAAAEAGKHVFCEKPFTLTVDTGAQAIAACEKAGVVLGVGHNRRYIEGARKMKALVDAGALGTILHVEANYSGNLEGRYPPDHWRVQQDEIPCAGLTPMGLHMVDTLTWILGPITRLTALAKHRALSHPINDTCAVLFELASGATGSLGTHLACAMTAILRIYGSRAVLEARNNFTEVSIEPTDPNAPRTTHRFIVDNGLPQELAALADACDKKATYPVRPAEALRNVAVLEAIQQSSGGNGAWRDVRRIAGAT